MSTCTLAYVPVVHRGVIDFLNANRGRIFILDNTKSAEEFPYFERDLRALPAVDIKKELEVHGYTDIEVIDPKDIRRLLGEKIIAPDDEAVRFFVQKYAPNLTIEYVSVFLRWNKIISTKEFEVPPNRTITTDEFSNSVMLTLNNQAQKSSDWWRQVGAAIVREGKMLYSDFNRHLPSAHAMDINGDPRSNLNAGERPDIATSIHAEAALIARAAREGTALEGASLYTTTFPCPVCARLISETGIRNVFYEKGYSTLDAEDILRSRGIEIVKVEGPTQPS